MHRLLPLLFIFSIALPETKTVAISYFDNTSGTEKYNPLSKGLADMLITDLSNVKSLKIVEREKLESLLKEIELGDGKFIDPNTAQKLGKGLGASYMLTGSFLIMGKTIEITDEYIDNFLEYKKGKQAFMVLSILYPDLQYNVIDYDQDHIHPSNNFRTRELRSMGLTEEEIVEWGRLKDQIPNLQMMKARSNKVKNKTPFKDWIVDKKMVWSSEQEEDYFKKNYIPDEIEYNFKNFIEFFKMRKKKIKKQLISTLSD